MQAHVRSKDTPVVVHAEKIGQLAGATTHFQNQSALWNLLIQKAGEYPLPRLLHQGFCRIDVVIVGERILFVERLHDIGNVFDLLTTVIGYKQHWDSALAVRGKDRPAAGAS